MSMVARPRVNDATDDTTDTDDGEARISTDAFWPDIVLKELRLAMRIPGRTTTSRLLHSATEAVAHVTAELDAWKQKQEAAGRSTLADVPAAHINGESVNVHRYRRAVYALTARAFLSVRGMWTPPTKVIAGPMRWTCRLKICGAMHAGQYPIFAASDGFMRS